VDLEYQRYGRNKQTVVNRSYIDSGEYRSKFDHITDNINVNRIVYAKAKDMLNHRSGTMIEDMYWIDKSSGAVVASALDEKQDGAIRYTDAIRKAISGRKDLIALHTHPQSMPPSAADFNMAFRNGYADALVICHDGKIFRYVSNQEVNERMYVAYIQNYIKAGYSEYEAQLKALEELKKNYDIDFEEVLP